MKSAVLPLLFVSASAFAGPHRELDPIPAQAREAIRSRMKTHGELMRHLVWDVLLLDYEAADQDAVAIARDARLLDRRDRRLEHLVYFFEMQDRLVVASHALSDAAVAHDDAGLSSAWQVLSDTCVRCHAAYRGPASSQRARGNSP